MPGMLSGIMHDDELPDRHCPDYLGCACGQCEITAALVTYMMLFMEPTDRALRLPGDIYPAGS